MLCLVPFQLLPLEICDIVTNVEFMGSLHS